MDKEMKAKWVEALRSGKYKQAKKQLKRNDGAFCCLGVLCEISEKGQWDDDNYYTVGGTTHRALLPAALAQQLGLGNSPLMDDGRSLLLPLYDLNDNFGFTFNQLADVIDYFL